MEVILFQDGDKINGWRLINFGMACVACSHELMDKQDWVDPSLGLAGSGFIFWAWARAFSGLGP
jgi:hypothetical protein